MNPQDVIEAYYAKKKSPKAGRTRPVLGWDVTPYRDCGSLGDTCMLTDLLDTSGGVIAPHSPSRHFAPLFGRTHYPAPPPNPLQVEIWRAWTSFDLGGGHILQRLRRLYGIPLDPLPKASLRSLAHRVKGRVVVHLEPDASHAKWQRENIHPRAREFYPEHLNSLREFARERKDLEFVTVGGKSLYWCRHENTPDAAALVDVMGSAEWFIGVTSGPSHVAAAMGLKSIMVVNFPDPRKLILPTLVDLETHEMEWLYPQNVHLHEDASGPLVPKFSKRNLHRAFDGEVYPFWRRDWLGLVNAFNPAQP